MCEGSWFFQNSTCISWFFKCNFPSMNWIYCSWKFVVAVNSHDVSFVACFSHFLYEVVADNYVSCVSGKNNASWIYSWAWIKVIITILHFTWFCLHLRLFNWATSACFVKVWIFNNHSFTVADFNIFTGCVRMIKY